MRWGSISQIDVMLMLLKKAQDYDFKYISLISGDDIPLMSNKTRNNFLDIAYENRAEFIGTEADCKNITIVLISSIHHLCLRKIALFKNDVQNYKSIQ